MTKVLVFLLVCLSVLTTSAAFGEADPLMKKAVQKIRPDCRLDVTMSNGDRHVGIFRGLESGRLRLENLTPGDRTPRVTPILLADIVRLREERSGAGRGFSAGFTTGALVGGSVSLLWGLAISSMDSNEDNTMGIIGFSLAGAMVGGVGAGTIGAGIGVLTDVWYTVYESPEAPASPETAEPGDTRLALGAGVVSGYQTASDFQETGFYGQFGLQKPLGPRFQIGPEIGYYDLDGIATENSSGIIRYSSVSPVVSFGLTMTYQSPRIGWSPYLIAGTGYYISGGEYLGLSFGGGVCYRTAGRQDIKIEIRDHVNIYDGGHDFYLDYFLTLGANFSFGL